MIDPDSVSDRIVRRWLELDMEGESVTQILVVETDIEMAAGQSGFDAQTLDAIKMAAHRESRTMAAPIGRIRIVPIRY